MKEKLDSLLRDGEQAVLNAKTAEELQKVNSDFLGKQGAISELLKALPKMDAALRPEMGKAINLVKNQLKAKN